MTSVECASSSPQATRALGRALGALCTGGECLLLHGPLGAGKTCFVQGLALGLGVSEKEPVVSPTFVIHAQYAGRVELNHVDAYRLAGAPDVPDLGLEELYEGPGVTAVEWAEFLGPVIPAERLDISLAIAGPSERALSFEVRPPSSTRYAGLLERFAAAALA
ncbi:MAG: tRNA (adenosine(37)-N6)-threonylcarbamoyltransferase complex ATPase subunit type 1 TsaE [Planctomycetota bacterium]